MEADHPFDRFEQWFEHASRAVQGYIEAMALATATPAGKPSVRMVLLRGWDRRGFRFFTNYESSKGQDLTANPHAAAVFYWHELGRQIRISGTVERLSPEESDQYFNSRPRGSQIGAWVSKQSQLIPTNLDLQDQFENLQAEMTGRIVIRPPHWGGFRLIPEMIEFWQSRPNRLHDRTRYVHQANGAWKLEKLYP